MRNKRSFIIYSLSNNLFWDGRVFTGNVEKCKLFDTKEEALSEIVMGKISDFWVMASVMEVYTKD